MSCSFCVLTLREGRKWLVQGGLPAKEEGLRPRNQAESCSGLQLLLRFSQWHGFSHGATAVNVKAAAPGQGLLLRPGFAPCRSPSVPDSLPDKGLLQTLLPAGSSRISRPAGHEGSQGTPGK